MTNREVKLTKALILILLCFVLYITLYLQISSISEKKVSIKKYTSAIEKLNEQHYSNKTKNNKTSETQIYTSLSLSEITDLILNDLHYVNIEPDKYKLSEEKNNYVEFTLNCAPSKFINYLITIDKSEQQYYISYITLKNNKGNLQITIRYKPEYRKFLISSETQNISKLFSYPVEKSQKKTQTIIKKEINIEDGTKDYKVIGIIENDNKKFLYIKKNGSSRTIQVPISDIQSSTDNYYIIKLDSRLIKIHKKG